MNMKNHVTITNKGQTTIPAPFRRKLGLATNTGGTLDIRFEEATGEVVISKPLSVDELSEKLSKYIKQGTKPLAEVDSYYQANRESRK
jgi:bifunctional DNA-binding transcriptional regulator/antitoxin component of YhaV-PrlF toxin-antitoxin module